MLSDRIFRYGWEAVAASFRMVKVVADIKPAEGARRWDEIVWWHGTPGQRSIGGSPLRPRSACWGVIWRLATRSA